MTQYDAAILEEYATSLYNKALTVVVTTVVLWFFVGVIVGGGLLVWIKPTDGLVGLFLICFSAVVGGFVGHNIGSSRAFKYRLDAQNTLCQVAIERNTRKHVDIDMVNSPT